MFSGNKLSGYPFTRGHHCIAVRLIVKLLSAACIVVTDDSTD